MTSLSARTLRRRPDLVAARAWRATVPRAATYPNGHASAILLVLVAFTFLFVMVDHPEVVPWAAFLPIIVISGVIHRPGDHAFVVAICLGCLTAAGVLTDESFSDAVGSFVAGTVIATVTMWRSMARARVGVQGRSGEAMLDELRVALERRAVLPRLPHRWCVEGAICPAFDHPFSGDFIVSHLDAERERFEAVLVDVSGKGLRSATRAVQLSGALDALVGAVPPEDLLGVANDYVLRQQWGEGYATAVHLVVDLLTGDFEVRRAGHPPAAVFHGGSGHWAVAQEQVGPALGLVADPEYRCDEGVLRHHDAVLLYSDGLVEQHDRALDDGIDRLLGKAECLVTGGFDGGARRLCAQAPSGDTDDRSVILLWRE
ncbi:PP2C family protein-serine/threonine phosphatase [Mobilicoccus massiliensis]|uniref:PP2C family protein-serine/threonine phosphatase n=1 Tax=Mobilicoccus massiliensis TaxID=1522310 RepID=UPI0009E29973|nr:PP2C family protein-serine/threonine phosphatase [Mobilicoccus massiliensis]